MFIQDSKYWLNVNVLIDIKSVIMFITYYAHIIYNIIYGYDSKYKK